jgi:hypothetical protein
MNSGTAKKLRAMCRVIWDEVPEVREAYGTGPRAFKRFYRNVKTDYKRGNTGAIRALAATAGIGSVDEELADD